MSIQTSVLLSSREGEITPDLARIDLNTVHSGPEWEESLEVPEEEMREEGGFVSVDGYLYRLAPGDTKVHRFSVMIGVWGRADPIQSVVILSASFCKKIFQSGKTRSLLCHSRQSSLHHRRRDERGTSDDLC